jgi:hypothetical protein
MAPTCAAATAVSSLKFVVMDVDRTGPRRAEVAHDLPDRRYFVVAGDQHGNSQLTRLAIQAGPSPGSQHRLVRDG